MDKGMEPSAKKGRKSSPLNSSGEGSRLHGSLVFTLPLFFQQVTQKVPKPLKIESQTGRKPLQKEIIKQNCSKQNNKLEEL